MDPATLQRLRENSGLRLDGEGRFLHEGEPVEHERLALALHRGLHRAPDGRWATRLGADWAYVQVDDAARFVRAIEADDARAALRAVLLDGAEAELRADTLALGAGDALYLRWPDGERARLSRAAQLSLSDRIVEQGGGRFALRLGARLYSIGADGGPEPVRRA
jgi:hypothetical protein